MADDFERELDAIFAHHRARLELVQREALAKGPAQEDFILAAKACLTGMIAPALQQMVEALMKRGVAARVISEDEAARIDIPVSRHARLGQGQGGYPFFRARVIPESLRIRFERNTIDSHGASALGDYPISEINAELVRAMVLNMVRALYGPF